MEIKFDPNMPIYVQIMNCIKADLVKKNITPGEKLPSVRELSSKLKVNPNTLQRAYNELEREGITYTQRGTGTFVREDLNMIGDLRKEMALDIINSFIEGMKKLGFENEEIIMELQSKLKQ